VDIILIVVEGGSICENILGDCGMSRVGFEKLA
jgi:hypothetical protein